MKKIALCIGNDEYKYLPPLSCCVADAHAMGEMLGSLGFQTNIEENLDREKTANVIIDFIEKCDQYDAILLYYAGHGFQADGDNILAPIDLNINDRPPVIRMNAFTLSELMNQLNHFPEQTKIIILDACRDSLGYRGGLQYFAPVSAPQGSIVAFSTSPGQASKENSSIGHGKYTEALLRYMVLPRVPVETVFKKVRETLVSETGGTQIPWEHTSLIGEFYFNPDTIYDGVSYSREARADSFFRFSPSSEIKRIVDGLKTYNWPQQEDAIRKVVLINFSLASSNELFVLGRNVYQAACGSSFACQRFINSFCDNGRIPDLAKVHILNGMIFEIYFNPQGKIRDDYKTDLLETIIKYVELPEFYASKEFIASYLCKIEDRPIYIPGQNELMYFLVDLQVIENNKYSLRHIEYQGKHIFFNSNGTDYSSFGSYFREIDVMEFEQMICSKVAAPKDFVRIQFNYHLDIQATILQIPYDGFSLRLEPNTTETMEE